MNKTVVIGRFIVGFGVSTELWYTTRKNDSKAVNLFNVGYYPDAITDSYYRFFFFVLILPFLIFRIGWVFDRNRAQP